jgi:hypothetical protein
MTDCVWNAGVNQTLTLIRKRNEKAWQENQPMTDCVWNAGVNQTLTLIEAKINQSESLAGKPAND